MLVLKVTWGSTILRTPLIVALTARASCQTVPDHFSKFLLKPQASATTAACSSLILHSTVSTAILPVKLAVPPGIWKHQIIHDVGTGCPDGDIWGTPVILEEACRHHIRYRHLGDGGGNRPQDLAAPSAFVFTRPRHSAANLLSKGLSWSWSFHVSPQCNNFAYFVLRRSV